MIRQTSDWNNGMYYYKHDPVVRAAIQAFEKKNRSSPDTPKKRGVITELAILAVGVLDMQGCINASEERKQERIDIVLQTLGLERRDIGVITCTQLYSHL